MKTDKHLLILALETLLEQVTDSRHDIEKNKFDEFTNRIQQQIKLLK